MVKFGNRKQIEKYNKGTKKHSLTLVPKVRFTYSETTEFFLSNVENFCSGLIQYKNVDKKKENHILSVKSEYLKLILRELMNNLDCSERSRSNVNLMKLCKNTDKELSDSKGYKRFFEIVNWFCYRARGTDKISDKNRGCVHRLAVHQIFNRKCDESKMFEDREKLYKNIKDRIRKENSRPDIKVFLVGKNSFKRIRK